MMTGNWTFLRVAESALQGGDYELGSGYCERFVRQVMQAAGASEAVLYCCGTAWETYLALSERYVVPAPATVPGALLFKDASCGSEAGHVAFYSPEVPAGGPGVIENSSTDLHRVRGALGWRTADEFGDYQGAVVVPDPAYCSVEWLGGAVLGGRVWDGVLVAPLRELAPLLGATWTVDGDVAGVEFGGAEEVVPLQVVAGVGWCPVRALAEVADHVVSIAPDVRTAVVS
jgi:hypothetical protein